MKITRRIAISGALVAALLASTAAFAQLATPCTASSRACNAQSIN